MSWSAAPVARAPQILNLIFLPPAAARLACCPKTAARNSCLANSALAFLWQQAEPFPAHWEPRVPLLLYSLALQFCPMVPQFSFHSPQVKFLQSVAVSLELAGLS